MFPDFLYPVSFVAFFAGFAFTLYYADVETVRRTFLGGFITVLLLSSLVGHPVPPSETLHKFSQPDEDEVTFHRAYVADGAGDELYLDSDAVPPLLDYHQRGVSESVATEHSNPEARATSCHLLKSAKAHRQSVLDGPGAPDALKYPPHALERHWSPDDLDGMGEFTELRIYRFDLESSSDGSSIESRDRTLVYSTTASEVAGQC